MYMFSAFFIPKCKIHFYKFVILRNVEICIYISSPRQARGPARAQECCPRRTGPRVPADTRGYPGPRTPLPEGLLPSPDSDDDSSSDAEEEDEEELDPFNATAVEVPDEDQDELLEDDQLLNNDDVGDVDPYQQVQPERLARIAPDLYEDDDSDADEGMCFDMMIV